MKAVAKPLPKLLDETVNLLAKFVVPLYHDDVRRRPSQYGSGFFVKSAEHCFFVSAAHVLETLKTEPLYYYVSPSTTRKLSGKLLLSPWKGDRVTDPIDVGVIKLTDEGLPPYPEIEKFAMDISYLRPHHIPRNGKAYAIVGFPASRGGVNPLAGEVTARVYGYRNFSIDDAEYSTHGLTNEAHVALPLDLKVGFDSSGQHRNFPRPQGMSGSPIWTLFDEIGGNDDRVFPVVAVGTKYRKAQKLLIGTDVAVVLDMINSAV